MPKLLFPWIFISFLFILSHHYFNSAYQHQYHHELILDLHEFSKSAPELIALQKIDPSEVK